VLANIDPTPDDGVDKKEVGFYNAVNGGDETTFVNAANKAYLHIPAATTQTAFYRFRFEGDETTGIEGVNDDSEKVEGIYDLQGRKLTKITEPGIYIVNGKKYYVK
jgi:hypothetical protein